MSTTIRTRIFQISRVLGVLLGAVLLLILAFLFYTGFFAGNVRAVVPGRVYRSAQIEPKQLTGLIREHKLRTVISLRGGEDKDRWFRREADACRAEGVVLQQVRLRATELPPPTQVATLLSLFDNAKYPLLFHCRGGADRSGLAATIYLHIYEGVPLDEAQKRGLTWHYGHIGPKAAAMDAFFDLYRLDGQGMDLRTWITKRYPQVYTGGDFRKLLAARRTASAVAPAH